jgi:hypothetical protein
VRSIYIRSDSSSACTLFGITDHNQSEIDLLIYNQGMKKIVMLSILLLAFGSTALAQNAHEPKKGSPERYAIMNAIRAYDVKRDSGLTNETFVVSVLRVQGTWAYANVEQQGASSYGQAHVFLQKAGGKWKVAFSTYNDTNEVGVDGLARLRKKNRSFPRGLADFAMKYLAG